MDPDHSDRQRTPLAAIVAALFAVYVIWGTTYFAIRVAVRDMSPYFLVATRMCVAGVVLLVWTWARGRPLPSLAQWRGALAVGCLLLVLGNGSVSVAERWVSSGAAVALISIVPLATAVWSGVFGAWPRRSEWLTIGLGALGAAIMLCGRDLTASSAGTLILLGGAASWSLGTVLARRLPVAAGAAGFGSEMLCAGAVSFVVSAVLGEHWTWHLNPGAWAAWGYLVVFGSLIGFSAYRFIVERLSPTLAATYAYVNPPVGLLTGWWLGGERFSPLLLLGLPVVLVAVGLQTWIHTRGSARSP